MVDDYNFKQPPISRRADRVAPKSHDLAEYEIYDYPGEFDVIGEGRTYARTRLEEAHAQHELAHAATTARGLCTGSTFKLKQYPQALQNREYLVVAASHELEFGEYEAMEGSGTNYSCSFTAL